MFKAGGRRNVSNMDSKVTGLLLGNRV